jgi:hypothetical protein
MHPYDHARSSAKIHGGVWSDYYAVHAWFDASKAGQCRFTHRALRHHIEGVAEAVSIFGPSIANRDGVKVATEQLGMQHLEEDCTYPPEATVWLIDFDAPEWLPIWSSTSGPDSAELAYVSASRFGGAPSAYLELHAWFLETRNWSDGSEHLLFRHHAFGVFEAESTAGIPGDLLSRQQRSLLRTALAGRLLAACYGAGVDSTALLVALKLADLRPGIITFADLLSEKPETIAHLERMQSILARWGGRQSPYAENVRFPEPAMTTFTATASPMRHYLRWPSGCAAAVSSGSKGPRTRRSRAASPVPTRVPLIRSGWKRSDAANASSS